MSVNRAIVQVVEIDIDRCTQTFGDAPCLASMSPEHPRKCYNSFDTCSFKAGYTLGKNTLKFISQSDAVKAGTFIPALLSVTGREQEVNIAGFTPNIGGLGQRASVTVNIADFPYNDVLTDKYWSERISGAGQINEPGYNPRDRGSFWTKFRARNPNYAGRALRVIDGHINDAGFVVYDRVRHYIIDTMEGPGSGREVTIKAKDVLALADDKKAQAPIQSQGRLLADLTAGATSMVLSPAGIGNSEYPASGHAVIGSEVVAFTRSGDTLTLRRGRKGTDASTHSANDSVQVCYVVNNVRADIVIRDLLVNYGKIPASYIDADEWAAEFRRWGPKMLLNATICKPTGVTQLISEINQLGITLWWEETTRKIKIKLNHVNEAAPIFLSDRDNIIEIDSEDNDDERATQIWFWTVQIDPTKDLGKDNFLRGYVQVFADAETSFSYGGSIIKTIYCRWLNRGADSLAKIVSSRLLNRYKRAPVTYDVVIDAKDDIHLVDVVNLSADMSVTDVTGKAVTRQTQVFYRQDDFREGTIKLKLQAFQFDGRYGFITENSRGDYSDSTTEQRSRGTYIVGPSLTFPDGSGPYVLA